MKIISKICFISTLVIFISCAEVLNTIGQMEFPVKLTEADVSNGLKEALNVGTKNSVNILSMENGFFGNELLKIALPSEANMITDNISIIPGGNKLVDDVVLRLNRAAEDAVTEAGPIFLNAITSMTINDAFNVLHGPGNAATAYLKKKTYFELQKLFMPKVINSLDKKLIGNISTNESWSFLTNKYNSVAKSVVGMVAGLEPINVNLDQYVTTKALDGLFLKVTEEEKEIRKNPQESAGAGNAVVKTSIWRTR